MVVCEALSTVLVGAAKSFNMLPTVGVSAVHKITVRNMMVVTQTVSLHERGLGAEPGATPPAPLPTRILTGPTGKTFVMISELTMLSCGETLW